MLRSTARGWRTSRSAAAARTSARPSRRDVPRRALAPSRASERALRSVRLGSCGVAEGDTKAGRPSEGSGLRPGRVPEAEPQGRQGRQQRVPRYATTADALEHTARRRSPTAPLLRGLPVSWLRSVWRVGGSDRALSGASARAVRAEPAACATVSIRAAAPGDGTRCRRRDLELDLGERDVAAHERMTAL